MNDASESHGDVRGYVATVVAAYVSRNQVSPEVLANLIQIVTTSFMTAGAPAAIVPDRPQPAVPIKKSVFADHIVCLEDGKKLKMLKRHLKTAYNMTPEQYRERWGLPSDYPMVAPNYATQRSALAKQIGLGSRSRDGKPTRGKAKTA